MSPRKKAISNKSTVLHQKGANGLLAEYHCARRLADRLSACGLEVSSTPPDLAAETRTQIAKYGNELTGAQFARAEKQGEALGDYLFDKMSGAPADIGLPDRFVLKEHAMHLECIGHDTSKSNSADIVIECRSHSGTGIQRLPVSLKAYASTTTSLGSKAATASLGRLFMGKAKPKAEELVTQFGAPAAEFLELLADFKVVAKEFYEKSEEGKRFVEEYFARKGTRRVNNKLRRKELGAYYDAKRGYVSEHRFANLFSRMFSEGYRRVAEQGLWEEFFAALLFLWGMEDEILTLNAVAGADGHVMQVENSLLSSVHGRLRRALRPGVVVELISSTESGTLRVRVRNDQDIIDNLSLSIWKDATIQFKLTT